MFNNGRMRKSGQQFGLPIKALNRKLVPSIEELECNRRISGSVESPVDDAHTAAPNEALDNEPVD